MITREELKDIVRNNGHRKIRSYLYKNKISIDHLWEFGGQPTSKTEIVYCVVNDVKSITCGCGVKLKFRGFAIAYPKSCGGMTCPHAAKIRSAVGLGRKQSEETKAKVRATNLERYGGHPLSNKDVRAKIEKTSLERYGTKSYLNTKEFKEKQQKTLLEKYGTTNVFNLPEFQEKAKDTLMEKYGVVNISQRHLSEETKFILHHRDAFIEYCTDKSFEMVARELGDITPEQISNLADKYECREIFGKTALTSYESAINDHLISMGIEARKNDRTAIHPKEIDLYLVDRNIAFEINGLFWHSDNMLKDPHEHQNKFHLLNDKDISFLGMWTDELNYQLPATLNAVSRMVNDHLPYSNTMIPIDRDDVRSMVLHDGLDDCQYYRFGDSHGVIVGITLDDHHITIRHLFEYGDHQCTKSAEKVFTHIADLFGDLPIILYTNNRLGERYIPVKLNWTKIEDTPAVSKYTDYNRRYDTWQDVFGERFRTKDCPKVWDYGYEKWIKV